MLSLVTLPSHEVIEQAVTDRAYLRQRMSGPQRHRLLHGYPLAAAMRRRTAATAKEVVYEPSSGRGLLVGVLPHPFCNPTVTGCGFCTFPHEVYHSGQAAAVVERVVEEIGQRLARQPELQRRPVTGLYFGGGTANLTPAEPFRRLCRRLAQAFDLSRAEVTLEGVPAYFVNRRPLLIDILHEEIAARHFRLSMGVQTFDERQLRQMGRRAFGNARTFQEVVELAHARGCTISADLLFNLPGQTLEQMQQDVAQAMNLGLDHLGLYHLVLFRGLGTPWARDSRLVADIPANEQAVGHWLSLRQLFQGGFGQTTLTNFERTCFQSDPRRFLYEESSFQPDRFEMLGFGPSAISFAADRQFAHGLKTLNPDASADYLSAVDGGQPGWDRYFDYRPGDLRVFYLTRRLAALLIERNDYRQRFGSDLLDDFAPEFAALTAEELVTVTPADIRPTPQGMFYGDAIAALLAWRQIRASRSREQGKSPRQASEEPSQDGANENGRGYM